MRLHIRFVTLVLLAIGRTANIAGLGLEKIGVHVVNEKVLVDENEQTNLPHIYALGDVATGKLSFSKSKTFFSRNNELIHSLRCYSPWQRFGTSSSSNG